MGPLVRIEPYHFLYLKVQPEDCEEIFRETVLGGRPVERLMYHQEDKIYPTQEEIPFYARQTRVVLEHCGHIDAEHIDAAIAAGAYEAFAKALFTMTPEEIIKESSPAAHQFIHGIADGPVPFRYPAGDYLEEL